MKSSETIVELAKALNKFQREVKAVPKTSVNPFFKSKYADFPIIWDTIREPLLANGFSVSQMGGVIDGLPVLTTLLMHTSGEWIQGDMVLATKIENDPQAVGSAITYGRRYSLGAILGISTEDDDDAEAAMKRTARTGTQAKTPEMPQNVPVPTDLRTLQEAAFQKYRISHDLTREAWDKRRSEFETDQECAKAAWGTIQKLYEGR